MEKFTDINGKEIDIKQLRNNWALALMSQGIIVKIALSRWRGIAPLDSTQLGLRFNNNDSINFMKDYVVLGHKNLLPPKIKQEIDHIERKARETLKEYSFNTIWGKFVPFSAFNEWEKKNNEIKEEYIQIAASIHEKYDELIQIIKEEYKKMAKDAWLRLYVNQGNPTESFIEDYVSRIILKIPSRNDLVASFKYEATYFIIPMQSLIEDGTKDVENNIQINTKKIVSEEYLKRKQELIENFLEVTVIKLRNYISEESRIIATSIKENRENKDVKVVNKKQLNKIKKMISRVNILNFYGDREVKTLLSDIEEEIIKFKEDRNKEVILEKLNQIIRISEKELAIENFTGNGVISVNN